MVVLTNFLTVDRSRYFRILPIEYRLKFIDLHTLATWSRSLHVESKITQDVFCTRFVQDCAVLHTFPILVNIHIPIIWYSISIQFPLKISRISISASLTWRWEKQSVKVEVLNLSLEAFFQWHHAKISAILPLLTNRRLNTLRPQQDGRRFRDDVFNCIFLNEIVWISIKISVTLFPRVQLTIFQHLFR